MIRALFFSLVFLTASASSAADLPYRATDGTSIGWHTSAAFGAAWTDLTAASFTSLTDTAIPAGAQFVTLTVRNRHATQVIYVRFGVGGATPVASAFRLNAGESFTFTLNGVVEGTGPTIVSVQGSGAATEADLTAWLVRP